MGGPSGLLVAPHLCLPPDVCRDRREGGKFQSCKLVALLGSLPPKLKACVESLAEVLMVRKDGDEERQNGTR